MPKFILSSKINIDYEKVIMAMKDLSGEFDYFLDIQSGQVGKLSFADSQKRALNQKRYYKIPAVPANIQLDWMKDFTVDLVGIEDGRMYTKLLLALNSSCPFSRFQKVVDSDEAWRSAWECWQGDCVYEEMQNWFNALNIGIKEDWSDDLDDDCPLCRLMKEGEDGLLRTAFNAYIKFLQLINKKIRQDKCYVISQSSDWTSAT